MNYALIQLFVTTMIVIVRGDTHPASLFVEILRYGLRRHAIKHGDWEQKRNKIRSV